MRRLPELPPRRRYLAGAALLLALYGAVAVVLAATRAEEAAARAEEARPGEAGPGERQPAERPDAGRVTAPPPTTS